MRALARADKAVVHFHGGLVSEGGGLRVAAELERAYEGAGASPVFFVWNSDAFAILKRNLAETAREETFQRLVEKVVAFAAAKLGVGGAVQARGDGLTPLPGSVVDAELAIMFTMSDEAERADRVFSFVYPHSLLYWSPACERDAGARSEGAKPLVGLQRWCRGEQTAPPELPAVRGLWRDEDKVIVWSPTAGERPDGFAAGAVRDGDFDNDPRVKESLKRLIAAS